RGSAARRPGPGGGQRLSLRRRAGGALPAPPGPALGGATRALPSPLRDRARSRAVLRLWLARRPRPELRLRAQGPLGGLALRLCRWAAAVLGRGGGDDRCRITRRRRRRR